MIAALLSAMNCLTAASGRAARSPARRWKRTEPATVIDPSAVNTATAIAVSVAPRSASAIDAAAVSVSARFFGLAPGQRRADAHGEQAGDPARCERRSGGPRSRRAQDDHDGHDRDRAEGDHERRRVTMARCCSGR